MKTTMVFLVIATLLTASAHLVHAQSGGGYDLTWYTIDGGGITFSSSGNYQLDSTIGQPDTGALNGEGYALLGGFWGGGALAASNYKIYLPIVVR